MSACNFSCSDKNPAWSSNSDITGPGVIINYVATSGMAILIIIAYYFTTYQPTHDPFERIDHVSSSTQSRSTFHPNPVDVLVLTFVRRASKKLFGTPAEGFRPYARLESFFMKSILAMSDLQIVTGLSILISGFVQLKCGLSTYYWLVIVYLAWFSSLTHLSCLTLVRHHLYSRGSEREWRLLAMGVLATLLVVGLGFTGNYSWAFDEDRVYEWYPPMNKYAACHLRVSPTTDMAFISMIISVFLIVVGFASRVVKLHRSLSVGVIGRSRDFLSSHARRGLRVVFKWCSVGSPRNLRRTLCYYPLLAAFLELRLLLDYWSSMLLEVGWLLVAFVWGIVRLVKALLLPGSYGLEDPSGGNNSNWGFGQVVALVLLVAPFITLAEYFCEASGQDTEHNMRNDSASDENRRSLPRTKRTNNLDARVSTAVSAGFGDFDFDLDPDHPDNAWQHRPRTLGLGTVFITLFSVSQCIAFVVSLTTSNSTALAAVASIFVRGGGPLAIAALFLLIMISLLAQQVVPQERTGLRISLEATSIIIATLPFISPTPINIDFYYFQPSVLILYIAACVLYRFLSKET